LPSVELIISVFLAILVVASILSLKARLPYTLVLVFVGIALAGLSAAKPEISQVYPAFNSTDIFGGQYIYNQLIGSQPGGGLFVGLVVPPLIFQAMMHTRSSDLKSVIRPSIFLATLGVVIATIVGGLVLWKIVGLPETTSFLFSAVIAPTDAATVLEIFRRAKVPSKLSALMDTEASFNDATGVIIFSIVLISIELPKVSLLGATENFALVFGGGVLIGLLVAFLSELLASLMTDRLSETILSISVVYGSYALATAFGFSGLVAVAIAGLYFGNLTIRSAMGPATREAITIFWEIAVFLANSVAFLVIGLATNIFQFAQFFPFILVAFLAVTAARIASVYPILGLFDKIGEKIPMKWRNVAMLGGMRGALSVALAASIPLTFADRDTIKTMVLGVAFISISIQAAILFRYIKRKFPEEQSVRAEELNVRLSKAVSAIEALQKLKEEGKISDEEFAFELEKDKDDLGEVLSEIHSSTDTAEIVRSRASGLYTTMFTLPMTRAMQVLKLNKMDKPIENLIDKTAVDTPPNDPEKNKGNP